jgi:hypothetical protein
VSCREELYALALRVGRRHGGEGNGSSTYRRSNGRPLELGWPIMALEGGGDSGCLVKKPCYTGDERAQSACEGWNTQMGFRAVWRMRRRT